MNIIKSGWNGIVRGTKTFAKIITDLPIKAITTAVDWVTYPVTTIMSISDSYRDLPQQTSVIVNTIGNTLSYSKNKNIDEVFQKINFDLSPQSKAEKILPIISE